MDMIYLRINFCLFHFLFCFFFFFIKRRHFSEKTQRINSPRCEHTCGFGAENIMRFIRATAAASYSLWCVGTFNRPKCLYIPDLARNDFFLFSLINKKIFCMISDFFVQKFKGLQFEKRAPTNKFHFCV